MDFDILAALEDRSIEVETLADKERMQIEYINVKDIIPARNDNNFYDTDDVITLKESIRVEGVKQNLIVKKKNNEGKYELIAGERRWKACKSLYEEGIKAFEYIPCVINKYEDDLKDRLSLITTNCTARKLTDWERTEQVEALNNILKEYKQRGIKLPAPRKDLISKLINESKTNVARMLGLKNNLIGIFKDAMKNEIIGLSVAYELSTLPQDKQELMINQFKENGGLTLNNVKYIKNSLKNEVEDEQEERKTDKKDIDLKVKVLEEKINIKKLSLVYVIYMTSTDLYYYSVVCNIYYCGGFTNTSKVYKTKQEALDNCLEYISKCCLDKFEHEKVQSNRDCILGLLKYLLKKYPEKEYLQDKYDRAKIIDEMTLKRSGKDELDEITDDNIIENEHVQDEDKPIEICKTDNVNIYDKQKEDILLEYLRYFENKLKYYTELHSMAENEQDNDVLQSSLKAIEYTSELIEKVQSDLFALTDDEKYDIEDNKEN